MSGHFGGRPVYGSRPGPCGFTNRSDDSRVTLFTPPASATGIRSMEPDRRRRRISDLYHAALENPAERDAFLKEACAGDEVLRQEVESLLQYRVAVGRLSRVPGGGDGRRSRGCACRTHDGEPSARPLHDRGPAWRRRHGRGLSRARQQARARRRDQDPAVPLHRRSRAPRPLRPRSADPRDTQSPAHRRDLRAGRIGRHDRTGPRAGRGTDAGRSSRTRRAADSAGARHRATDRRRTGRSPRARDHPSRSEARQHRAPGEDR